MVLIIQNAHTHTTIQPRVSSTNMSIQNQYMLVRRLNSMAPPFDKTNGFSRNDSDPDQQIAVLFPADPGTFFIRV